MATVRTDVPMGFGAAGLGRPSVVTPDGAGRKAQRMPLSGKIIFIALNLPLAVQETSTWDRAVPRPAEMIRGFFSNWDVQYPLRMGADQKPDGAHG